jgi:hypothetical protein
MHFRGARLVKMRHGQGEFRYYIIGTRNSLSGYIEPGTAEKLISILGLVGQKDGLFPRSSSDMADAPMTPDPTHKPTWWSMLDMLKKLQGRLNKLDAIRREQERMEQAKVKQKKVELGMGRRM